MGFKWLCPVCEEIHTYGGKATTKATARCGSKNLKIWQYRFLPPKPPEKPPKATEELPIIKRNGDLYLGADFNKTVLISGLMDTIKIYKNKVLSREGKILKQNAPEGKKVLEWVERYDNQKWVPMLVVHQAYFQKVDLAYKELKKLRE